MSPSFLAGRPVAGRPVEEVLSARHLPAVPQAPIAVAGRSVRTVLVLPHPPPVVPPAVSAPVERSVRTVLASPLPHRDVPRIVSAPTVRFVRTVLASPLPHRDALRIANVPTARFVKTVPVSHHLHRAAVTPISIALRDNFATPPTTSVSPRPAPRTHRSVVPPPKGATTALASVTLPRPPVQSRRGPAR